MMLGNISNESCVSKGTRDPDAMPSFNKTEATWKEACCNCMYDRVSPRHSAAVPSGVSFAHLSTRSITLRLGIAADMSTHTRIGVLQDQRAIKITYDCTRLANVAPKRDTTLARRSLIWNSSFTRTVPNKAIRGQHTTRVLLDWISPGLWEQIISSYMNLSSDFDSTRNSSGSASISQSHLALQS